MKKYLSTCVAVGMMGISGLGISSCALSPEPAPKAQANWSTTGVPSGKRVLQDYLNFLNTEVNGKVIVQTQGQPSPWYPGGRVSSILDAFVFDAEGHGTCDAAVQIGNNELTCVAKEGKFKELPGEIEGANGLWGTSPTFFIEAAFSTVDVAEAMYVPQRFIFNEPNDNIPVTAGTRFSWEPDPEFADGLILLIDYVPVYPENREVRTDFPDRIYRGKVIPDNGAYTITAEDLADFPPQANLLIDFIRGNYEVVQTEDNKVYALAAYSKFHFNMPQEE